MFALGANFDTFMYTTESASNSPSPAIFSSVLYSTDCYHVQPMRSNFNANQDFDVKSFVKNQPLALKDLLVSLKLTKAEIEKELIDSVNRNYLEFIDLFEKVESIEFGYNVQFKAELQKKIDEAEEKEWQIKKYKNEEEKKEVQYYIDHNLIPRHIRRVRYLSRNPEITQKVDSAISQAIANLSEDFRLNGLDSKRLAEDLNALDPLALESLAREVFIQPFLDEAFSKSVPELINRCRIFLSKELFTVKSLKCYFWKEFASAFEQKKKKCFFPGILEVFLSEFSLILGFVHSFSEMVPETELNMFKEKFQTNAFFHVCQKKVIESFDFDFEELVEQVSYKMISLTLKFIQNLLQDWYIEPCAFQNWKLSIQLLKQLKKWSKARSNYIILYNDLEYFESKVFGIFSSFLQEHDQDDSLREILASNLNWIQPRKLELQSEIVDLILKDCIIPIKENKNIVTFYRTSNTVPSKPSSHLEKILSPLKNASKDQKPFLKMARSRLLQIYKENAEAILSNVLRTQESLRKLRSDHSNDQTTQLITKQFEIDENFMRNALE